MCGMFGRPPKPPGTPVTPLPAPPKPIEAMSPELSSLRRAASAALFAASLAFLARAATLAGTTFRPIPRAVGEAQLHASAISNIAPSTSIPLGVQKNRRAAAVSERSRRAPTIITKPPPNPSPPIIDVRLPRTIDIKKSDMVRKAFLYGE
jgi:hypothetical protein